MPSLRGDRPTKRSVSVTLLCLRGLIEVNEGVFGCSDTLGLGGLRWERRRRRGFSDHTLKDGIADSAPLSQWLDR